jgi:hypothetical protein
MVSGGRTDTRWCVTGNDRTHWPGSPIFASIALAVRPVMAANTLIDGGAA